jgi:hypothetical protein
MAQITSEYKQFFNKIFKVLTVVVMKVSIFWDIALCSPYMNQHFGGTYHLVFGPNHRYRTQFTRISE